MTMRTGTEVTSTTGTRRGVVVDGHVNKSGPNRGRLSVIWIGGYYPVAEYPADLVAVITLHLDPSSIARETSP